MNFQHATSCTLNSPLRLSVLDRFIIARGSRLLYLMCSNIRRFGKHVRRLRQYALMFQYMHSILYLIQNMNHINAAVPLILLRSVFYLARRPIKYSRLIWIWFMTILTDAESRIAWIANRTRWLASASPLFVGCCLVMAERQSCRLKEAVAAINQKMLISAICCGYFGVFFI